MNTESELTNEPTDDETIDLTAAESAAGEPVDQGHTLQSQLADAQRQALLAQADLENFRKRNRRESQEQIRYAALPLMAELLEAVDNLKRAIDAAQSEQANDSHTALLEGVTMVAHQITSILQHHGCEQIQAIGEDFDPNKHQAVQMMPSEDFEKNKIMQELRAGFQLHERVIRPSQVIVSTGQPNSE